MEYVSPRVNSRLLKQHIGRNVRLTAKVIKMREDLAEVEASDGGQVQVKMIRDSDMSTTYVEIIGQVQSESKIKMLLCMPMGNDIDMQLVDGMVEMIHKHPEIFMDPPSS